MSAPGGSARRTVRRLSPAILASAWSTLGPMLRSRRRRVVVQPVLAVGIATLETAGLLTVVRLILLLVQRESTTTFAPPGAHIELTFVQLGLVGVACAVLAAGLRVVEGRYNARTIELAVTGARNLVIDAFLGSDWEEVRQRRVGSLQQQLGVNAMQAGTPVTLLAIVSLNGLQLLMFLALILAIAPQVAVMFGLLGLVATATMTPLRKASRRRSRAHAAALADLQLSATSYSLLGRELALFGVARAAAAELKAVAARTGQQLRGVRALARIIPGLYQQVLLASVVLIVLVAERLDLDATAFGTAAILGVRSLSYLQAINNSTVSYLESQPMLDDLLHTVRLQRRSHRTPGTRVLDRVSSVELTDVGYRYSDGTLALDGINLRVSAGEWIGIVGPSGAGKTTLANILVGLTQPTSGTMLVNGIAAAEFDPDSWARQFALVTQEPTLLRATVRENVAFYRSRDEARVIEAAADAGVRDEIELLPQGFDTPVGDGNATLSGGQRQRVAIARALLDRPSCLLLDEPTSALDAANEALIEEALLRIDRDTIVVIVSHRPKLLERCDRIVNLENGRLEPANA